MLNHAADVRCRHGNLGLSLILSLILSIIFLFRLNFVHFAFLFLSSGIVRFFKTQAGITLKI